MSTQAKTKAPRTLLICDTNIVIKMTSYDRPDHWPDRWLNTTKLSDEKGKHTGDEDEIRLCKETLGIHD